MKRHAKPRPDYPGTGGDFARHLLKQLDMAQIEVETSDKGDHYDPLTKRVRLEPGNFDGKSLTAIAIAAHEVGHALQDKLGYRPLQWRTRLAVFASLVQQLGNALIILAPLIIALTKAPSSALLMLAAGLTGFAAAALVHLVTLPVEWDASFRRALPLLEAGHYLSDEDQRKARQILTAAALTYVAGSLASLLNLWRWLRLLRR